MAVCCALQSGGQLKELKPTFGDTVDPRIQEIEDQWAKLEEMTKSKGAKLFDDNRPVLYEQACDDIDGWITEVEAQMITEEKQYAPTTVSLLVQKQNVSCTFVLTFIEL